MLQKLPVKVLLKMEKDDILGNLANSALKKRLLPLA
jgi:hypothetical protein